MASPAFRINLGPTIGADFIGLILSAVYVIPFYQCRSDHYLTDPAHLSYSYQFLRDHHVADALLCAAFPASIARLPQGTDMGLVSNVLEG